MLSAQEKDESENRKIGQAFYPERAGDLGESRKAAVRAVKM